MWVDLICSNFIELAGDDKAGKFYAWLNTLGWGLSYLTAEGINILATYGGARNWAIVWGAPAARGRIAPMFRISVSDFCLQLFSEGWAPFYCRYSGDSPRWYTVAGRRCGLRRSTWMDGRS